MTTNSGYEHTFVASKFPVTLVEIVFAVVIGGSILQFHELLFPPLFTCINLWALLVAYFTAIASWFGWHKSTIVYPYTDSRIGRLRSVIDGLIVVSYAALMFFGSKVDKFLVWYLWVFVVVFFLYFVVGELRRKEYRDPQASQIGLIICHEIAMLISAIAYTILLKVWPHLITEAMPYLFVFLAFVSMASFRWFREWRKLPWRDGMKKNTIAVDMDGVLVEQVVPVLQKLKKEKSIDLCKNDITEWEYPIGDTDIKSEIERAERDEEFVQEMPPVEGASEALKILSEKFDIVVATSRETCSDPWSYQWLAKHSITYDRFINTRSEGKVLQGINLLIDDYIGNIEKFTRNKPPDRRAILFAQPWNRNTEPINDLIEAGKVKIAHSWQSVLAVLGSCKSL
jgi:5'(3')-deoxyribonucleotidase